MTKRLIILSCAIGSLLTVMASDPSVTVVPKQGSMSTVNRSEVSRINLNAGTVEIVRKNGDKLTFDKETISRILLADDGSGVEDISESGITVSPKMTQDIVKISGITEPTDFYLFDINGQTKLFGRCCQDVTEISIGAFQKGLYLLVVGQETFKIIKK